MDTQPVIHLLTEARDFLATGNWTQGRMVKVTADGVEHRDMMGALLYGGLRAVEAQRFYDDPATFERFQVAEKMLILVIEDDGFHGLKDYNDHPGRTLTDVLTAFDVAIARLDGSLR